MPPAPPTTPPPPPDNAGVLVTGMKWLVAAQVGTRLITFALNLATARRLSMAAYGVAAVQYHLINTTILLLAREGLRRGCLTAGQQQQQLGARQGGGGGGAGAALPTRQVLATAGLALPAGCVVAAGVVAVATRWGGGRAAGPAAVAALRLQVAAALVELAAEPLHVLASLRVRFGVRVAAEAVGTLLRGVLSLWLLSGGGGGGQAARVPAPAPWRPWRTAAAVAPPSSSLDPGVALSWAQLAYGASILGVHLCAFAPDAAAAVGAALEARRRRQQRRWAGKHTPARRPPSSSSSAAARAPRHLFLDPTTLALCRGFTLQAAEKLVLGEGSRAVLAASAPAAAQGAYGLAANVGSLAVRTLFAPVEEAAFLAFARPGAAPAAGRLLAVLARSTAMVGGLGAAFGPPFAFAAVRAAYGPAWACGTAAPPALGAYAAYTALLALNGVLEAFAHARGGPAELAAGNAALLALAALGAALGVVGSKAAGAVGLVAADGLTMAARIAYALGVTRRVLGTSAPRFRPGGLLPSARALGALAVASAVCSLSDTLLLGHRCAPGAPPFWGRAAAHAGMGVLCLAGVVGVVVKEEGGALAEVRALRGGGGGGGKDEREMTGAK